MSMKIYKFGGTSVGSPERMKEVCRLITEDGEPKIVVLSAMSGTTNSLVEIATISAKPIPRCKQCDQSSAQHLPPSPAGTL